jgi:hypothetical protein
MQTISTTKAGTRSMPEMRDGTFTAMVAVMPEEITRTVAETEAQNPRGIAAVLGGELDFGCSLLDMLNLPNARIAGYHNDIPAIIVFPLSQSNRSRA